VLIHFFELAMLNREKITSLFPDWPRREKDKKEKERERKIKEIII
jgi:hypothetical protein